MNSDVANHLVSSMPWYLVRAFGLTSVILLTLMILSGIGLITGHTFRFWPPIKAWAVHRAIGISFGVSLFFHIFFLLFDQYKSYTLAQILIPGLVSTGMSLGIIAFYLIVLIIVTSLVIIEKRKKTWKNIHFFSYGVIFLVFFHALSQGTDLHSGILRYLWIIIGIFLLVAMVARLMRAGTIKVTSK